MIETRFKDTEVGRIPEDWKVKSIKDFTDIITGATPSTSISTYWNSGSIRWMSSGELNNKFIFDVEGRITQLGYNNTGTHMLPKHCVLIGLAGQGKTRGTAAYNHVELCTNQSIAAVLPDKDNFDSLYLYYFVDSQYKYLRALSAGDGGRGGLNKKILLNLNVAIPSKSEQKRIATALSNIDALISELGKLIEKKRAIKQGAMQQLLTGKIRLKGFTEPWVEKKLGEICDVKRGVRVTRESLIEEGEYPVFQNTNFPLGYYDKFNVAANTPFVIVGGSAGLVGFSSQEYWAADDCAYFDNCKKLDLVYLYYNLLFLQNEIKRHVRTASVPRLDRKNIEDLVLPIPPLREQSAIASVLTSMDNEISALEAKREKYSSIKQGMMQQLLTGKIRLVETAAKTNTASANVHFRRSVWAAEIADRLCEEPTFGHVKMEKILFLTERLCHIDIGSHYHRDAAGPYDNRALRSIDSQLKKQKWFEVRRTEKGNRYVPMQNRGKHKTYFDKYFSAVLPTFEKIIKTFKTQNTERCEIVATLYSAWEDFLNSNKTFTDADIVNEVLNNWHESKKRISRERWLNAIQWMRENGFVPNERNG